MCMCVCRFLGHRKTIFLERKHLITLMDKYETGLLSWEEFSSSVKAIHADRMGTPRRRKVIPYKPKEEDYFYANSEECMQMVLDEPWTTTFSSSL